MFVDASVLVAILAEESDAAILTARLDRGGELYTSPLALYEATLGLARATRMGSDDAKAVLDRFLAAADIVVIPITEEIGRLAVDAFVRFGGARHSASLNMGDCFAYACARSLGVPLLFKGDDFSRTDITAG